MHPQLESFLERPMSHKVGAAALTMVLFAAMYWQYSFKPQYKAYTALVEDVEKLSQKITDETRRARNLNKLKELVKDLDVKLKVALQELPDKREIPDLLSSVSSLARDAGLEVQLFRPIPEVQREFYAEVPVSISVEGTFHQVATFFDEVAQLPRVVNINQIVMRDAVVGQESVRIKTDCTATTFRYLDESERISQAGAGAQGHRRGR